MSMRQTVRQTRRPSGETGKRTGLKIQRRQRLGSSTLPSGTNPSGLKIPGHSLPQVDAVQITVLLLLICTVLFIYPASSTRGSLQRMWQTLVADRSQTGVSEKQWVAPYSHLNLSRRIA